MIIKLEKVNIQSKKDVEVINITSKVKEITERIIKESSIKSGLVHVTTPYVATGIVVNENLPCVQEDILFALNKLAPKAEKDNHYHHARYLPSYGRLGVNIDAHIKNILTGTSAFFVIEDGKMLILDIQAIYFLEFDGPSNRNYYVQILGE